MTFASHVPILNVTISVFERLRKENSKALEKIEAVEGNLDEENLGLAESDASILRKKVEILFHSAAILDMDSDMKSAVECNLGGTRRLLKFADTIQNLEVFVHVSTGFVHTENRESSKEKLKEELVPLPQPEEELMNAVTSLNAAEQARVSPILRGPYRDWYSPSKSYAEWAVAEFNSNFQKVIVRPTSVSSAWKDPVAGFNDSKNSLPGIYAGIYIGLFRRIIIQHSLDVIPVDVAVNSLIVSAWDVHVTRAEELSIYHAASGKFTVPVAELNDPIRFVRKFPSTRATLYPDLKIRSEPILFYIGFNLLHVIPSFFLDLILIFQGKRPRALKSQDKFFKLSKTTYHYSSANFNFDNQKMISLHQRLNDEEREIFPLNVADINWHGYMDNLMQGVRKYLLQESDRDLKAGRKLNYALWLISVAARIFCISCLWFLLSFLVGKTFCELWCVPVILWVVISYLV